MRAKELPEGITPNVERALKSRKKSYPNQPEEERWKDVYRILFPYEDVPTACKFRFHIRFIVLPRIANHVIDFEPVLEETVNVHDLDNFEEYIRREMPIRFRSLLERHFDTIQPGSDIWKDELVSAVEHCHASILSDYRLRFSTHQNSTTSTTSTSVANPDITFDGRLWGSSQIDMELFGGGSDFPSSWLPELSNTFIWDD